MRMFRKKIYRQARRRGIGQLVHFTPAQNVPSILKRGLESVDDQAGRAGAGHRVDPERRDGQTDAVSVSIETVNRMLLERQRRRWPEHRPWVIVLMDPRVLWTMPCAFCPTNAASSSVVPRDGTGHLKALSSPTDFRRMFDKRANRGPGSRFDLLDAMPSDEQAEVLVYGRIKPRDIIGLAVPTAVAARALQRRHPSVPVLVDEPMHFRGFDRTGWRKPAPSSPGAIAS